MTLTFKNWTSRFQKVELCLNKFCNFQVLVQAVTRRIDSSAGNLMRVILNLMNETSSWAAVSTQVNHTVGAGILNTMFRIQ